LVSSFIWEIYYYFVCLQIYVGSCLSNNTLVGRLTTSWHHRCIMILACSWSRRHMLCKGARQKEHWGLC
jgi:hypothetical protein